MVTTRGGLETNADSTAGGRLRIRLKGNGSVWGASLDGFGPQLRTVRILDSPALIHQEPPWIRPARVAAARGSDGRGAGVLVHDGDAADCHYGAHVNVEHACPPAADDDHDVGVYVDDGGDDDLLPGCGYVGDALADRKPARLHVRLDEDGTSDDHCDGLLTRLN